MKSKMKSAILICMTAILLFACGSNEVEEVSVPEQETETEIEQTIEETPSPTPTPTQEATPEPEPAKTYIEEHGLEFFDGNAVETKGMALDNFNHADYIETDVDFEWEVVSIEDSEDGYKTVVVKQTITGYRWFDGRVKKTDVTFPSAFVVDIYTGLIIPKEESHYDEVMAEQGADIEWNGETYHISYVSEVEWDFENQWTPMADGNFAGWCTDYNTLTITVPENYDGLALLLPPVLSIKESTNPDEHIMDYWTDEDCYLFKVDTTVETENEESASKEVSTEKTENATTTSTSVTKQEDAKTQETKPQTTPKQDVVTAHSHSYTESVAVSPTCSSEGTKVYSCSCGDSYSESIPANGNHQWVQNSQVIHHESQGHMESTPTEVNTFYCRGCGGSWTSVDEIRHHSCDHSVSAGTSYYWTTETTYDNQWVVDSEEWDETVTYNVCSICGATQ